MKKTVALLCALLMVLLCGCEMLGSKKAAFSTPMTDEQVKAAVTKEYEYYEGLYTPSASYEENYKISVINGDVTNSSSFCGFYSVKRDDDNNYIAMTNEITAKVGNEESTSYMTYVDGKLYANYGNKKIMGEMTSDQLKDVLSDTTESIDIRTDSFGKVDFKRTDKGSTLTLTEPDDICFTEAGSMLKSLTKQTDAEYKEAEEVSVTATFDSKNKLKKVLITIKGKAVSSDDLELLITQTNFSKKSEISAPKGAENHEKMTSVGYYGLVANAIYDFASAEKESFSINHDLMFVSKKGEKLYADTVYKLYYNTASDSGLTFTISYDKMRVEYDSGYLTLNGSNKQKCSAEQAAVLLAEYISTSCVDMSYVTDITLEKSSTNNKIFNLTVTDDYILQLVDNMANFYGIDYQKVSSVKNCYVNVTLDNDHNIKSITYFVLGPNIKVYMDMDITNSTTNQFYIPY